MISKSDISLCVTLNLLSEDKERNSSVNFFKYIFDICDGSINWKTVFYDIRIIDLFESRCAELVTCTPSSTKNLGHLPSNCEL